MPAIVRTYLAWACVGIVIFAVLVIVRDTSLRGLEAVGFVVVGGALAGAAAFGRSHVHVAARRWTYRRYGGDLEQVDRDMADAWLRFRRRRPFASLLVVVAVALLVITAIWLPLTR